MPTLRVVTGSYEHNLLGVAFTFGGKSEFFTPIFHFTPHTQSIRCLAWSKRVLASGANDEWIRLYDSQNRKELGTLMHHQGQILCMEFFANKWLISGASDGKIVLWRVKDWEVLAELKAHKASVLDISVHSSGKIMSSVGQDHKSVLWNLMTARKASIRKLRGAPTQVSFVPIKKDGKPSSDYIIGYDKKIVLYNANGTAAREWEFKSRIHRCKWITSQDATYLVASSDDGKLSFFELDKDEPSFVLHGHASRVKDFAIWNKYSSSISTDGNIVIWNVETRDQIGVYNAGDRLNCVVLMPDDVEKVDRKSNRRAELDREQESEDDKEESEPEQAVAPPPKKKKKAHVVVTRET